jgi:site-specific recombinase XerD
MVQAMVLGGLRRAEVVGLRLENLRLGEWRVHVVEGKGGHERIVPVSLSFFATVASYIDNERPPDAATDRLFVVLKGPNRGLPLSLAGIDEIMDGARARAGLAHGTCHELRHTCLTRLREAGMSIEALQAQAGHRSIATTQIYLHLGDDWLAGEYRRAAEAIEAQAMVGIASMSAPAPQPSALRGWERVATVAPQMVDTMQAYIDTVALTLAPSSVAVLETTLRQFAGRLIEADATCTTVAAITPGHVADFRTWLATKPSDQWGRERVSANTVDYRLAMLRVFFERVTKLGWTDSPTTVPIPRPVDARPPRLIPKAARRTRRDKPSATRPRPRPETSWDEIGALAPQMVATMASYLAQLAVSSRPATVATTSLQLWIFAAHLVSTDRPARRWPRSSAATSSPTNSRSSDDRAGRARRGRQRRSATTSGWCAASSSASSTGTTPMRPGGCLSSPATSPGRRTDAQVPRRPDRRQVHGDPRHGPQPAAPTHGRTARPHRHARR